MAKLAPAGLARLTAAWLAGGKFIDHLSLALTLLALAAALLGKRAPAVQGTLLLAVLFGCAEKYYALRVAFDRKVFADWARQWSSVAGSDPAVAMAEFDRALVGRGLRRACGSPVRSLEERVAGARTLLVRQAVCLVLQCGALLGAAALHLLRLSPA